RDEFRGLLEEIIAADDGFYPRQPERGGGVDRLDARVWMGTSQHLANQLPWQTEIRSKLGATGHLVGTVWTHRSRAHHLEFGTLAVLDFFLHSSGSSQYRGGVEYGAHDLVIAGAATQIASQPVAYFCLGWIRLLVEQGLGRHQKARCADAAL